MLLNEKRASRLVRQERIDLHVCSLYSLDIDGGEQAAQPGISTFLEPTGSYLPLSSLWSAHGTQRSR